MKVDHRDAFPSKSEITHIIVVCRYFLLPFCGPFPTEMTRKVPGCIGIIVMGHAFSKDALEA